MSKDCEYWVPHCEHGVTATYDAARMDWWLVHGEGIEDIHADGRISQDEMKTMMKFATDHLNALLQLWHDEPEIFGLVEIFADFSEVVRLIPRVSVLTQYEGHVTIVDAFTAA